MFPTFLRKSKKTYYVFPHTVLVMFVFLYDAQGQGVLSDKLRSFSMQDLTLINAEDELALHTSDTRMRRDPMDEMSSGASTLPRAKSTATRQSKAKQYAHLTPSLTFSKWRNMESYTFA